MVSNNFYKSLNKVLEQEGGYSNDPSDPGGPTMNGITERVYDAYRDRIGSPRKPVSEIRSSEVEAIYRAQYWNAIRADDLPSGVDYAVFDAAVNSGPAQAAKWLQSAVGVTVDGHVGEATLEAARSLPPEEIIVSIGKQRLKMLQGLKTWSRYGKGWSNRVDETNKYSLYISKKNSYFPSGNNKTTDKTGNKKPRIEDRSIKDIIKTPEGMSATGGLLATIFGSASNPGPLQWAISAVVVSILIYCIFSLIQRLRGKRKWSL